MTAIVEHTWSARWPVRVLFLSGLGVATLARLYVASGLELHFDEAYYWYWSKNPQLSYYDHPPMVAWLIRAGTAIVGDSELGVRLFGQISVFIASWLIFDAAERTYGERAALLTGFALQATLLLGAGSIVMSPDVPLLLFVTVVIWALLRFCLEPRWYWWPVVGIAGGAAMLSKYNAVLVAAAIGLWLLATPKVRHWLATPWPWVAAVLAPLVFSPVLIWNYQNDWISFGKQGGRLHWSAGIHPGYVLEFIGGQVGVITPILFALLILGVWETGRRAARGREPIDMLLTCLFLVPFVFFFVQSPFMHVQANWPSIAWPAAFLATAALLARADGAGWYRRLLSWSLASGAALVALAWLHALRPGDLCLRGDPLRSMHGNRAFAQEVAGLAQRQGAQRIFVADYATASTLRFYAPGKLTVTHIASEPRYTGFAEASIAPTVPAVIISRTVWLPIHLSNLFKNAGSPFLITRKDNNCVLGTYYMRSAM